LLRDFAVKPATPDVKPEQPPIAINGGASFEEELDDAG
jgi:hypothetical protein